MNKRSTLLRAVSLAAVLTVFGVAVAQADGFVDSTSVSAHASPGTNVNVGTRVTVSGKLQADHSFCRKNSKVTLRVYGETQNEDFPGGVVDTDKTGQNGSYEFHATITEQVRVRVWFKGKVGGVHPNIKTCEKSRSQTITFTVD